MTEIGYINESRECKRSTLFKITMISFPQREHFRPRNENIVSKSPINKNTRKVTHLVTVKL